MAVVSVLGVPFPALCLFAGFCRLIDSRNGPTLSNSTTNPCQVTAPRLSAGVCGNPLFPLPRLLPCSDGSLEVIMVPLTKGRRTAGPPTLDLSVLINVAMDFHYFMCVPRDQQCVFRRDTWSSVCPSSKEMDCHTTDVSLMQCLQRESADLLRNMPHGSPRHPWHVFSRPRPRHPPKRMPLRAYYGTFQLSRLFAASQCACRLQASLGLACDARFADKAPQPTSGDLL